jgi:alpha/beta superfamily hydrolase
MIPEREVTISVADGNHLEARVAVPVGARAGLVCCHPHPLYGGDMDNPVVVRVVEVAAGLGLATCRFNFRGVGRSTGMHGQGRAERLDVEVALDHLEAEVGGSPPVLAGYSFGAVVAAAVAGTGRRLGGVVLIAPPVARATETPFLGLASRERPTLVVAGTRDEYCPEPALRALEARLAGAQVVAIEGADHFFSGALPRLGQAVGTWLASLEARQPRGSSSSP